MGVARQGEAEMADIVRAIGGLHLAAQDHLVDQRRLLGAGDLAQYGVEVARKLALLSIKSAGTALMGNAVGLGSASLAV